MDMKPVISSFDHDHHQKLMPFHRIALSPDSRVISSVLIYGTFYIFPIVAPGSALRTKVVATVTIAFMVASLPACAVF